VRQQRGNVGHDEQEIEREAERDDRKRFQNADAQEQERKNVGTRFGLTGDGLDGFRSDDAVADGRAECDAEDDQSKREDRRGGN